MAIRALLAQVIRSFLPVELGGPGANPAGTARGNTGAFVAAMREAVRRSGWKRGGQLVLDLDGDGFTTIADLEIALANPLRSDPEVSDPVMAHRRALGEAQIQGDLDRLRETQGGMITEWLSGMLDSIPLPQAAWYLAPEPVAFSQSFAWLSALPSRGTIEDSIGAVGVDPWGRVAGVGYLWRLLMGGWTPPHVEAIAGALSSVRYLVGSTPVARWFDAAIHATKSLREGSPVGLRIPSWPDGAVVPVRGSKSWARTIGRK